jgi:hypothetical protein
MHSYLPVLYQLYQFLEMQEENRVCEFQITYKESAMKYFHQISRNSPGKIETNCIKFQSWCLMDKIEAEYLYK